jgi:hypothetical protein
MINFFYLFILIFTLFVDNDRTTTRKKLIKIGNDTSCFSDFSWAFKLLNASKVRSSSKKSGLFSGYYFFCLSQKIYSVSRSRYYVAKYLFKKYKLKIRQKNKNTTFKKLKAPSLPIIMTHSNYQFGRLWVPVGLKRRNFNYEVFSVWGSYRQKNQSLVFIKVK